jgi:hypothetical protein
MLDGFDPNNYKGFDTLMLAITGMAGNEVTLSK